MKRRPTIDCSNNAEIVYGDWVPCLFPIDSEDSPSTSTVDHTFWSEIEIQALIQQLIFKNQNK